MIKKLIKKIKKSKKEQIMEPEETKTDTKDANGFAQAYVSKDYHSPSPAKKRLKKLGVGLAILAVLLGTGWFLYQQGILSNLQELFSPIYPKPQPVTPQVQVPAAQVTITAQGFIPQTLLIKKGTKVTWTNKDNKPHQIFSDPHPIHSQLPALNQAKPITPNSSYSYTFNAIGTFTYHDEGNPLKFKVVVVVK